MVLISGNQDKSSVAGGAPSSVNATTTPAYPTSNKAVATSAGCCAAPGASPAVLRVRRTAIAIIVFHVIALCALNFFDWVQWIGSLMGIIMASVLLCVFQKYCYIAAAIIFAIGGIFDVVVMIKWILLAQAFDDFGEDDNIYTISSPTYYGYYYRNVYYYSTSDAVDEATDEWGDIAGGLAIPPAVAALTMFLGSAFAIMAVISWAQSGALDAPRVVEMPAVSSVGGPGTAARGANNSHIIHAAAVQRPPPAYSP